MVTRGAGSVERQREDVRIFRVVQNGRGVCVMTAVPNTKLCAWGEEDSGGLVL